MASLMDTAAESCGAGFTIGQRLQLVNQKWFTIKKRQNEKVIWYVVGCLMRISNLKKNKYQFDKITFV